MVYNLDFINTSYNILELTKGIDTASGGILSGFLLLSIFVIVLIVSMGQYSDIKKSFLISSFGVSLVAVPFWIIGMIGYNIVIYPVILLIGSLLVFFFSKDA